MSEISIEALAAACAEKVKRLEFSVKQSAFDSVRRELETELAIARVALLALRERAEPVAWLVCGSKTFKDRTASTREVAEQAVKDRNDGSCIKPLYTAPPAPVAAGWIACSERMPENDGNYWAWWSESKRQGPAWFIKSELQAQFQSSEITHWMPLPEAPAKN